MTKPTGGGPGNGDLEDFLRKLLTLEIAGQMRPVEQRTFLIALLRTLTVVVNDDGTRKLKIDLSLKDLSLINSREKHDFQTVCSKHNEHAEFVAKLATPGTHVYTGRVPWRWSSAGYAIRLIIDGEPYWVFFLRRGVNPAGWNLANGAGETLLELLRPQDCAEREAKEELILVNASTRRCYRLEVHGGKFVPTKMHQEVLHGLWVNPQMDDEPLVGNVVHNLPDVVYARADWDPTGATYVSERGLVIFNDERGEAGIEFIQVAEWVLNCRWHDLRAYDGETLERLGLVTDRKPGGSVERPIGFFAERDMIMELQKPNPVIRPRMVFDRGNAYEGMALEHWLADKPEAKMLCPVTRKTMLRFFFSVCGLLNNFRRTAHGTWLVTFAGRTTEWKNSRGLETLAYVIENQNRSVEFDEIDARYHEPVAATAGQSDAALAELAEGGIHPLSSFDDEMLDGKSLRMRLRKLGHAIKQLKEEKAAAERRNDGPSADEIQADIEKYTVDAEAIKELLDTLARTPRGGRARHVKSEASRMRQRIRRSLQRVLQEFFATDRVLHEHFFRYLKYGRHAAYTPPPHIVWKIHRKPGAK